MSDTERSLGVTASVESPPRDIALSDAWEA